MDMEGKSDCRTREGHFLGERTVANFHTFKYNLWQYVDICGWIGQSTGSKVLINYVKFVCAVDSLLH